MTSFIRMPALKAALRAAARLQQIKAKRRQLWQKQIESYKASRFVWPWSKPLSDSEARERIYASGNRLPDHFDLTAEMKCHDVLTLFREGTAYVYLDADTLRRIT